MKYLASLILVGVVLVGGYLWLNKSDEQPQGSPQYGSVSSPDTSYDHFTWGGQIDYKYSESLNQASTTVCSFLSPPATTTLVRASMKISTGTTTALVLYAAKSTSPSASTTLLGDPRALASFAQVTFFASTTPVTMSDDIRVIAPSNYVNFSYQGPSGALNTLVGNCQAEFVVN